eukprot:PhF_6_TR5186/c0_g1_i3/m.7461
MEPTHGIIAKKFMATLRNGENELQTIRHVLRTVTQEVTGDNLQDGQQQPLKNKSIDEKLKFSISVLLAAGLVRNEGTMIGISRQQQQQQHTYDDHTTHETEASNLASVLSLREKVVALGREKSLLQLYLQQPFPRRITQPTIRCPFYVLTPLIPRTQYIRNPIIVTKESPPDIARCRINCPSVMVRTHVDVLGMLLESSSGAGGGITTENENKLFVTPATKVVVEMMWKDNHNNRAGVPTLGFRSAWDTHNNNNIPKGDEDWNEEQDNEDEEVTSSMEGMDGGPAGHVKRGRDNDNDDDDAPPPPPPSTIERRVTALYDELNALESEL